MKKRVIFLLLIVTLLSSTGCQDLPAGPNASDYYDFGKVNITNNTSLNVTNKTDVSDVLVIVDEEINIANKTIVLGSFNVQIFGQAKSNNEFVMDALGNIIDDYDLLGFQEIRDISETSFPKLMREELSGFNYKLSSRLGRTSSKEQYSFIYNPRTITLKEVFVYDDVNDVFEREPYVGYFSAEDYDFVVILIHVKPTDAQQEIKHLEEVVNFARGYFRDNDIFIMGDLSADCAYYEVGTYLKQYQWIIGDELDTTTSLTNCAYDRIITYTPNPFIIASGVDRFDLDEANNDEDLVKAISDHYPVYVELKI